jgi:3-phosphoshikimate 1-carboxyvinyltransferase
MTFDLLKNIDVEASFIGNFIKINHLPLTTYHSPFKIESDWSSASYFYSIIALSSVGTVLKLSNFKKNSLQGDSILVEIYKGFGVKTVFENDYIILQKKSSTLQFTIYNLQLNDCPDLAQTIAVTCFGLGIGCYLTGLHTLKIKETDRLLALKTELEKLGGIINITNDSLTLAAVAANTNHTNVVAIDTYHDHRMAMAFATLAIKFPIIINDASVVSKSYPNFWIDLNKFGIKNTILI